MTKLLPVFNGVPIPSLRGRPVGILRETLATLNVGQNTEYFGSNGTICSSAWALRPKKFLRRKQGHRHYLVWRVS